MSLKIVKTLALDFTREAPLEYIFVKAGDKDSRVLDITPLNSGLAYAIPEGAKVVFAAKKPDKTEILNDASVNTETGHIEVTLSEQTLAAEGILVCEVGLYSAAGEFLSSQHFYLKASPFALTDAESSNEYNSLVVALLAVDAKVREAEEVIEKAKESEAERVTAESKRAEAESAREERLIAVENKTVDLERRVKNVESGVISGIQTDSSPAYQKTVPANALLYAELEKSGVFTTKKVKSTNLLPVNTYILYAPYEVGVKKEICKVELPAGMYYISFWGGYSGGGYGTSDEIARVMINDVESRYITLDTAQTVTVYAVMYRDDSANGSDFENHSFNDIGIFAVSYEGEVPSYERYVEPGLVNVPLTAIESNGNTYAIPNSMVEFQKTMLSGEGGYGGDYIDWANKKFVKCMKAVDMGALSWSLVTGKWRASVGDMKSSRTDNIGIICEKYTYTGAGTSALVEGGIANNSQYIFVLDSNYADKESFAAAMAGVVLHYEVKEPEIIDIDTDGFDRFIEVEPSGTITFVNANNAAIPSTITYRLEDE